jgi:hypothetical protein
LFVVVLELRLAYFAMVWIDLEFIWIFNLYICLHLGLTLALSQSNIMTRFFESISVQGSFEAFSRQCGCCGSLVEDEERREHLEAVCDLATHYLCHPCALCQEGRELRRRVPHPGFNNGHSIFVMMPPMDQTMGRGM